MTATHRQPEPLLLDEIGQLVAVPAGPLAGARMRQIPIVEDAALLLRDGKIAWLGPRRQAPREAGVRTLSARGGCVIPGLVDCHTHIPFIGDRSGEFVRRLAGETYLQIMATGGGIRATSAAVRKASVADLVAANLPRLARMLRHGVTRVECKSGYGLAPEHELKQLEAVQALAWRQPITLDATYLGAHAVPAEYAGRADAYVDLLGGAALLGEIAKRGLARFCDVFCDRGAFSVAQARRVLVAARAAGLRPKLHADELAQIGAARLAAEVGAVSADHLECIDDAGIAALRDAGVVPVVLPGTSFYLGMAHADARRLINADLPLALATDYNPGSCMIDSLPLVMNIACCALRLLPIEALVACTANAAAALAVHEHVGSLAPGYDADVVVLSAPTVAAWLYEVGRSQVRCVIKRGAVVWEDAAA